MKKLISVAVILLFLGLAFAPTINANVGKEELVEFTTEVCGLNGGKQTVKLTRQQADEVEALFNSIREQLNTTESREEAEEIFKEAVVELDKYGLLGGLSVKQAQRLVTGGYNSNRTINFLKYLYRVKSSLYGQDSNNLCLVTGNTDFTYFQSFFLPRVRFFFPTPVMNRILFGCISPRITGNWYYPSKGWIHTNGVFGNKSWEGEFWGKLRLLRLPIYAIMHYFIFLLILSRFLYPFYIIWPENVLGGWRYTGVSGFTGIKIFNIHKDNANYYYIGYALRVGLTYETPSPP